MIGLYASIPERGHWAGPLLRIAWVMVDSAGSDVLVGGPANNGWELRTRGSSVGLLGVGVAPMAIIAAIAIPNLLESRVTANEAAASTTLKSAVFPAEIQFQAGNYQDADENGLGEYGLLGELSGRSRTRVMEAGQLRLLNGPIGEGRVSGYHVAIFLPDGSQGAISDNSDLLHRYDKVTADAVRDQEKYFVAYAWPVSQDQGRKMFAICQDGMVRSLPWDGKTPAWNAVFAPGKSWGSQPQWPILKR
jgi:hypothetical protein